MPDLRSKSASIRTVKRLFVVIRDISTPHEMRV